MLYTVYKDAVTSYLDKDPQAHSERQDAPCHQVANKIHPSCSIFGRYWISNFIILDQKKKKKRYSAFYEAQSRQWEGNNWI